MAEAPRFTPSGVRVGSMPTPQVQAAPNALGAIGETIASLGQTAERVLDTREKRQAMADHAAKVKTAADESIAQDAFEKWRRDRDADYERLKTDARGTNIAKSYEAFNTSLKSDTQDYVKDLSPEQRLAFDKRKDFQTETYNRAADNLAHSRSMEFISDTSKREVSSSIDAAAVASASGDVETFRANIGRALLARNNLERATGEAIPTLDMLASARYKALDILVKESPEKAISYYQQNQSQFGAMSDNAAKLVQVSADKVSVKKHLDMVALNSRDANGNFSYEMASTAAVKAEEAYASDPLLKMDDQRRTVLAEQISQAAAADTKIRDAVGKQVLSNVDALFMQPGGHNGARAFVASNGAAVGRMLPEDRIALVKRLNAGPQFSDEAKRAELNNFIDIASTEDDFQRIEADMPRQVLSSDDRAAMTQRIAKGRENLGKFEGNVRDSVKKLWEEAYQRKMPSWKASGDSDQLTTSEKADIASFNAHVDEVWQRVKDNPKTSEETIRKYFKEISASTRVSDNNGGYIEKPYAMTTATERIDAKASQKKEDRRNAVMKIIEARRSEAGLGSDPGEPSTMSYIWDTIQQASQERNRRLGFAP